ncbi:MAG: hypothetical protein U9N06_02220 [candidate division WOR-3 bacterium]|nr:hypothetical protein [candidate division WOR-3 bacterium]
MRRVALLLILSFFISLTGCTLLDRDIVEGKGTITYIESEGGFYGIVADNGGHYDPMNLPSDFKKDGLRVKFKGIIRYYPSLHKWGTLIQLTYIEELQ